MVIEIKGISLLLKVCILGALTMQSTKKIACLHEYRYILFQIGNILSV